MYGVNAISVPVAECSVDYYEPFAFPNGYDSILHAVVWIYVGGAQQVYEVFYRVFAAAVCQSFVPYRPHWGILTTLETYAFEV